MAKLDSFLDSLVNYSVENINPDIVKSIQPYLRNPEFDPDLVRTKSSAAAGKDVLSIQLRPKVSTLNLFHDDILHALCVLKQVSANG
jgi:hypothetical protein